jgi:hypothetical protein
VPRGSFGWSCLGTRQPDTGPHPSLLSSVGASSSLISDAVSAAPSSPAARVDGLRSPCRVAVSLAAIPDRLLREVAPGSERAEEPCGNGPELPGTRNERLEGRTDLHSAFQSSAPLNPAESWPGWAENGALRSSGPFCLARQRSAASRSSRRSHYGRHPRSLSVKPVRKIEGGPPVGPDGCLVVEGVGFQASVQDPNEVVSEPAEGVVVLDAVRAEFVVEGSGAGRGLQ